MPVLSHGDPNAAAEASPSWSRFAPGVVLAALLALAVHALALARYGYYADELYYLDATRHLDWGFVEFAPLSIALLKVWTALVGSSLPAIRVVPVACGAVVVLLTGRLTQLFGGRPGAQGLAALAVAVSPMALVFHHYYSSNAIDHVLWLVAALAFLACLARPTVGRWGILGVVLGIGLQNRPSVVWLMVGLGIGLAATRHRRLLATPGPWLAAAIATVIFVPFLAWQSAHGWPFFAFVEGMRVRKVGIVTPAGLVGSQLLVMHPVLVPLAAVGLGWLVGTRAGRPFAPLALVYVTTLVILALAGTSKAYYPAPAFPFLFAAGAVAVERAADGWRRPRAVAAVAALVAVAGLLTMPLTLPLLPVEALIAYHHRLAVPVPTVRQAASGELPGYFASMQEWPEIVDRLATVIDALPAADRADAVVFTEEYTDAALVNVLGATRRGLPPGLSAQDSYALWGTGGASGRVLVTVGIEPERLAPWYASVTPYGTIGCRRCAPLRAAQTITVAREPRADFAAFFAAMRHFE